ncbi:unnamed protein product [Echinostoma caproni]|uniref:Reverse transcriptase domain-containing protein n=1 Tax=Echinostoma caproni TaxID=27848 RepID=A0A183AXD5_9TREM|nr:unnamed protein product [Echinostoma caproni]
MVLMAVRNGWTRTDGEGDAVDAIYLDFSKAFDRVNHTSSTIMAFEISRLIRLKNSSNDGPYQFVFLIAYPDSSKPPAVFHKDPYSVPVCSSHS